MQAKIQQGEDHVVDLVLVEFHTYVLSQQYENTVRHLKCTMNQSMREGRGPARGYVEPNAGAHLLREAGGRYERRREAVGCSAWLGAGRAGTRCSPPAPPPLPCLFLQLLLQLIEEAPVG